jgi:hypothetical protein
LGQPDSGAARIARPVIHGSHVVSARLFVIPTNPLVWPPPCSLRPCAAIGRGAHAQIPVLPELGGQALLMTFTLNFKLCTLNFELPSVHAGVFNVSPALHPRVVDRELGSQFGNLFADALLGLGVSRLR